MDKKILSALIGLTGAISNNGKTKETDSIVRNAVLHGEDENMALVVRSEKFRISPSCETCPTPCGNTSDYPLEKFTQWTEEQKALKEQVLYELERIASLQSEGQELPDVFYKALSYIGYDLQEDSYLKLLEEMKSW